MNSVKRFAAALLLSAPSLLRAGEAERRAGLGHDRAGGIRHDRSVELIGFARKGPTVVKKPRIGFVVSPSSMDAGWTRWVLEQYGVEYTSIAPADFPGTGALKDRFDVILLAEAGEEGAPAEVEGGLIGA